MFKILNVYLLALSIFFLSCAVSIQNLSKLQYKDAELKRNSLIEGGIALLPVITGIGMEGHKWVVADSLEAAFYDLRPSVPFVNSAFSLNKLKDGELSQSYDELIRTYKGSGILNKGTIQEMAKAIGKRFLLFVRLEKFGEEKVTEDIWLPSATIVISREEVHLKKGEVALLGELWDGENGDVVWAAQGIAYSKEDIGSSIRSIEAHLEVACRGLISKLP